MTVASSGSASIVIVDDDAVVLRGLTRLMLSLSDTLGLEVETFTSPREALTWLESKPVDVVFSDAHMSEMTGQEFLAQVELRAPTTVRILLSGGSPEQTNAHEYLGKPCDRLRLTQALERALERRQELLEMVVLEARQAS